MNLRRILIGLAAALSMPSAFAGSVFLTGHDILLHGGQDGYDVAILDYLRGGGPSPLAGEIARADYDILYINGGVTNPTSRYDAAGFGTTTTLDLTTVADEAAFAAALVGIDVIVYPWAPAHTQDDVDEFNLYSGAIATFFNAGGDIFANSGVGKANYYDFLPPGATTSTAPLSGSSGFTATAAGAAQIGMTAAQMNGRPTHNAFSGAAPAFTVMELKDGMQDVSIGLRDGMIVDDIITTTGSTDMPEPGTVTLLGLGLIAAMRRRRTAR